MHVPRGSRAEAYTVPLCCLAMPYTEASPSPVPCFEPLSTSTRGGRAAGSDWACAPDPKQTGASTAISQTTPHAAGPLDTGRP